MTIIDEKAWADAARAWDSGYDWYARNIRPLSEWFCERVATPGARVLDVCCGTGQPALAIAKRVHPGRVTATDLSPAMVASLERRRVSNGFDNVEVRVMDAQALDFEDQAFDAVTSSCGLMFCPDPVHAVREMLRVLAERGRFAVAVWDEPKHNPFFTVAGGAIASVLPARSNDPDAPGPFRLSAPGALERVLRTGGAAELSLESRQLTFELESVDEYFRIFTSFSGAAPRLAELPERDQRRARDVFGDHSAPFVQADGSVKISATALCASGPGLARGAPRTAARSPVA